ncbi:MAG TPA: hypothetical protein VJ837_04585, partial [Candidatus Paceibacterota bacterium]|nr:hypothetical protein [Candidatus Paceibacterota bacterium]
VRFILATSLLSIVAALDDTFLLHEQALPHVHIPEELTLAAYVAAGAAYVFSFWRLLLRTKVTLPVLAVLLIAASTALDLQYPMSTGRQIFFEEALKFGGIVSWLAFVWTASTIAITSRTVALPSSPD